MKNELPNLHPLATEAVRINGETSLRDLCARAEVAISPAAGYVSTAHASSSGNGASAREMAGGIA